MTNTPDPLFGPAPESVPLSRSPLVSVLAQVRFEQILAISKPDLAAEFQELIRARYPVLTPEGGVQIQVKNGQPELRSMNSWRFADAESKWTVTLNPSFMTLHTLAYRSRDDFMDRFAEVLRALAKSIRPSTMNRLGVRYVDQVKGDEFLQLDQLVSPEMRGIERPALRPHIVQSFHDTVCNIEEGRLRARWGIMPKETTHDLSVLAPISTTSWVFDVDAYYEAPDVPMPFDHSLIVGKAGALANRTYAVFRSVVTQQFLKTFGGEK